jgi:agmatine/peptidylarginine deiminase
MAKDYFNKYEEEKDEVVEEKVEEKKVEKKKAKKVEKKAPETGTFKVEGLGTFGSREEAQAAIERRGGPGKHSIVKA